MSLDSRFKVSHPYKSEIFFSNLSITIPVKIIDSKERLFRHGEKFYYECEPIFEPTKPSDRKVIKHLAPDLFIRDMLTQYPKVIITKIETTVTDDDDDNFSSTSWETIENETFLECSFP